MKQRYATRYWLRLCSHFSGGSREEVPSPLLLDQTETGPPPYLRVWMTPPPPPPPPLIWRSGSATASIANSFSRWQEKAIRESVKTPTICDSPLYRSTRRSFAPLKKLRWNHRSYLRTEALSIRYGFHAGAKAIRYGVKCSRNEICANAYKSDITKSQRRIELLSVYFALLLLSIS